MMNNIFLCYDEFATTIDIGKVLTLASDWHIGKGKRSSTHPMKFHNGIANANNFSILLCIKSVNAMHFTM